MVTDSLRELHMSHYFFIFEKKFAPPYDQTINQPLKTLLPLRATPETQKQKTRVDSYYFTRGNSV
jgi:hypothetical protein